MAKSEEEFLRTFCVVRSRKASDEAMSSGDNDRVATGLRAQFAADTGDVGGDSPVGEEERLGNLAMGVADHEQVQHFPLAPSQSGHVCALVLVRGLRSQVS